MNDRERAIIEAIIDKSDKKRHQEALCILITGKSSSRQNEVKYGFPYRNEYCKSIRNAVNVSFSGYRYQEFEDDEVYDTFLGFFVPFLESRNADTLRAIRDLKAWLFRVACNCANTNREKINEALGVVVTAEPPVFYDENWMNYGRVEQDDKESFILAVDGDEGFEWIDELITIYVDGLPIERDRVIVKAIKIDGMDRDELAAELGITRHVLDMAYEEAWRRVLKRALPDIRYRARKMFMIYESVLTQADAELLHEFFNSNTDSRDAISIMAREKKCTINQMETRVVDAYKRLLYIYNHRKEECIRPDKSAADFDNMKKMYRKKSNKVILHRKHRDYAILLGKYIDNYDGNVVEMSINEHLAFDELTQKIDYAIQLLIEIDKGTEIK